MNPNIKKVAGFPCRLYLLIHGNDTFLNVKLICDIAVLASRLGQYKINNTG